MAACLYPPQTKLREYIVVLMSVRSFVRPSVRPSQSVSRYSSKSAKQNFMTLSGSVHYMMPYCTSYFKILGCPRAKQGLCHYDIWGRGPISNPLLLLDRCTEFHETFRNCSLHDAILHLLFKIFICMILGCPRAKEDYMDIFDEMILLKKDF